MADTGFSVSVDNAARFAAGYERDGDGFRLIDKPDESKYLKQPKLFSGGGGLASTAGDYLRFCQMMLNKGGLDGVRILGRKTVELMTSNHLPNNCDLTSMGYTFFSESRPEGVGMGLGARHNLRSGELRTETRHDGVGFGLGGAVLLNPASAHILGSPGEYAWGRGCQHSFLGRSQGANDRHFSDPAHALVVLSHPTRAARARQSGSRRLTPVF